VYLSLFLNGITILFRKVTKPNLSRKQKEQYNKINQKSYTRRPPRPGDNPTTVYAYNKINQKGYTKDKIKKSVSISETLFCIEC